MLYRNVACNIMIKTIKSVQGIKLDRLQYFSEVEPQSGVNLFGIIGLEEAAALVRDQCCAKLEWRKLHQPCLIFKRDSTGTFMMDNCYASFLHISYFSPIKTNIFQHFFLKWTVSNHYLWLFNRKRRMHHQKVNSEDNLLNFISEEVNPKYVSSNTNPN